MNKTQHPSNNAVLGAPQGWDQGALPCSALAITRFTVDGIAAIASYWKPTAEELAMLKAGGSIELSVIGATMPPVALDVVPA